MSSIESIESVELIESMLSRVKRFTWLYTHVAVPSSISCLAFSVEEARKRIISHLVKIESLADENNSVKKKCEEIWQKVKEKELSQSEAKKLTRQLENELDKKYPVFDSTIAYEYGCPPVKEYNRSMDISSYLYDRQTYVNITLGEMILTIEPCVSEIRLVEFVSSMD